VFGWYQTPRIESVPSSLRQFSGSSHARTREYNAMSNIDMAVRDRNSDLDLDLQRGHSDRANY